jgi:hypothetical protein
MLVTSHGLSQAYAEAGSAWSALVIETVARCRKERMGQLLYSNIRCREEEVTQISWFHLLVHMVS